MSPRSHTRLLVAVAGAAALAACSSDGDATPRGESTFSVAAPAPSASISPYGPAAKPGKPDLAAPQTIATGLEVPWGLAFLPDGSALVAERERADIVRIPAGGGDPVKVYEMPGVDAAGEGGLLGLAVDPDYARN